MIPEGFHWNQAELERGHQLNRGLLSLLVITDNLTPRLIGTAFIVTANGDHAIAVTAAHCFEDIRKVLHPNLHHHVTTLPEFLPPPKEIDLKQAKAVYIKDGNVFVCPIEIGVWDSAIDLAVFSVRAPANESNLFCDFFWIDDQVPNAGEYIAMIGFGEMKVVNDQGEVGKGKVQRQLLLRLGRVEEVFPEKHYMLKGPCIQSSIAIFSGMSGGIVTKWGEPNTSIKPFAFISHAPNPQPSYDRSQSGHSMASILDAKIKAVGENRRMLEFKVSNIGVGKDSTSSQFRFSFDFLPTENGN